jgi:hypothetical protein
LLKKLESQKAGLRRANIQKAGQCRAQKLWQGRSSKSRTNLRKAGCLATLTYPKPAFSQILNIGNLSKPQNFSQI